MYIGLLFLTYYNLLSMEEGDETQSQGILPPHEKETASENAHLGE